MSFAPQAFAPQTKFRTPRLRRDTLLRPELLQRALRGSEDARLLLVQAPAGFGKTTVLVQLADALSSLARAQLAWVSLDADDNDSNRLFASLFGALATLSLDWPVPPQSLLAELHDAGPAARAALTPLLDALASRPGQRVVIVLDDLHHIDDDAALQLLDTLIDRLPPEALLLAGSRTPPRLSLARWRVSGELTELTPQDLQFAPDDLQRLCALRGDASLSAEGLAQAIERTRGWPAGLQLLLGHLRDAPPRDAAVGPQAQRHLFEYFAQEVLDELPPALRRFALHCAVLPELSPALCDAVTRQTDSLAMLEALQHRQLFVNLLDERVPVLRFHDLFRDFLRSELAREEPQLVPELHHRAALAETHGPRAVQHLLAAHRWEAAIARMLTCAEALLAEGAHQTLQRWIAQLPADQAAQHPELAELQALGAWARYDYPAAESHFLLAEAGYRRRGRNEDLLRLHGVLVMRARAHNSMGALHTAQQLREQCAGLPVDRRLALTVAGADCWQQGSTGPLQGLPDMLRTLVERVEEALRDGRGELLTPAINDLFNSFFVDTPGCVALYRRLRDACATLARQQPLAHWQVAVMGASCWPEYWHGERTQLLAAADRHLAQRDSLRHLPATWLDASQLRVLMALLRDDLPTAREAAAFEVGIVQQPTLAALAPSWTRSIHLTLARVHWWAQDGTALEALAPLMTPPRTPAEWPFVEQGRLLMLGQLALLQGRWPLAEQQLQRAAALGEQVRLSIFTGDPRLSLAWLHLQRRSPAQAWAVLQPVWEEMLMDDAIGAWLLEPPRVREGLLGTLPPDWLGRPGVAELVARLKAWSRDQPLPTPGLHAARAAPDLSGLSEREREVIVLMAAGHSNKQIARDLDLSPHTVKRHVANILNKLALDSRTQAAAYWAGLQGQQAGRGGSPG